MDTTFTVDAKAKFVQEGIVNGDQASFDDYMSTFVRTQYNVVVQEDGTTLLEWRGFQPTPRTQRRRTQRRRTQRRR